MAIIRVSNSDSDSTDSDYDSGLESDEFDLSDLGDPNYELIQVGNSSFSIPTEIFDLEDLSGILNIDTWNSVLTEKDRFQLSKFLPDMDYETFSKTLSQLFSGENFHFCRPFNDFFKRMKGGVLNPRVVLSSHGLNHFRRREYYHSLMLYQNCMVRGFTKARDAWENYVGCGIEEKMRVLDTLKNRRDLENDHFISDTEMEISGHGLKQIGFDDEDDYDESVNIKIGLNKGRKKKEISGFPKYKSKSGVNNQGVTVAAYNPHSFESISNAKYRQKAEWGIMGMKCNSNSNDKSKYATYGRNGALFSSYSEETESESEEENGVLNAYQNNLYGLKKSAKSANVDKKMEFSGNYKRKAADGSLDDIVLVKKTSMLDPGVKYMSYVSDKKRKGLVEINNHQPKYTNHYGANALNTDSGVYENSNMPLLVCNSVTKKQKGIPSALKQEESVQQFDEPKYMKKRARRIADSLDDSSVVTDTMLIEKEAVNTEPEPKPQKKQYIPITPTKHTDFSFSIVHLLTAVRKAMITSNKEGDIPADLEPKPIEENNKAQVLKKVESTNGGAPQLNGVQSVNPSASEPPEKETNLPCLTVQEIVDRVRKTPGDPHILETQEPLNDLVRGVLKLFSTKTAPLGAKAWKALVSYEKSNKTWTWVGPVSSRLPDSIDFNEETSPEAWGLPYKTLVKLVDSFANWFKSGQETFKLIGSLPPPPTNFLPTMDEKERFRDLRAQKSLNTIKPSSEEVRKYFRSEELLRYTIPDRAFSYTTADGKKSIVAPLRKGGGKPTAKAREHPILKPDRPPHVTILCLVRDAAARLPGSIGTRADVCTLIRDSQYVVEDVADEEVNKVVSGALDRLHYERDPCVQFQSERKLWVYLHKDREEEDFEDDGTSSTKKWKRPRKDASEQIAQVETVAAGNDTSTPTTVDQAITGHDLSTDANANITSTKEEIDSLLVYNDMRPNADENIQPFVDLPPPDIVQGHAMSWDPIVGLNSLQESQVICKENSTIDVLNDEAFNGDMPAGFLNANFM